MEKIETQFSVYKIDANLFTSVKGIKDKTKEQAAIDIILYLLAEIKKELYERDNQSTRVGIDKPPRVEEDTKVVETVDESEYPF